MKKSVLTVGATLPSLLSKCVRAEPRHQAYLEYCLRVCMCSSGSVLRVVGKNFALTLKLSIVTWQWKWCVTESFWSILPNEEL